MPPLAWAVLLDLRPPEKRRCAHQPQCFSVVRQPAACTTRERCLPSSCQLECGRVSAVQPIVLLLLLLLFACRYALPDFQRDEEGRIRLPGAPSAYFPR